MFKFNFEDLRPYHNERLAKEVNKIMPPYEKGLITAGEVLASVGKVLYDELDFLLIDGDKDDSQVFFNVSSDIFSKVYDSL